MISAKAGVVENVENFGVSLSEKDKDRIHEELEGRTGETDSEAESEDGVDVDE